MKIHEYQAKDVLRKFGVPVPKNKLALTADEAEAAAKELGTAVCVVKAQVHAGGRGKGGGVKVVKDVTQVREVAGKILAMKLVTPQTGAEGTLVRKVLVEQGLAIEKEYYLAVLHDRAKERPLIMASAEGGMDIEEVAAHHPEKILKEWVDPAIGLQPFQARRLAGKLGIPKGSTGKFVRLATALVKAYWETDAALVEVNPLVLLKDGEVLALDAKMAFDDNALYRHKDLEELRDLDEEKPAEIEAKKYDLSYIKLDGEIGCLVNGAGLAMATMDIIKLHGGEPANFLDVGGGATQAKVTAAFKIILTDPNVKAILVNIFGGIMRCDVIAQGVMAAAREVGLKVPLVVRLEGTNVELGRKMLRESGLALEEASDLTDAATKVVAAAKRAS